MFITPAWAQSAANTASDAAGAASEPAGIMGILGPIAPILLVFFIFYIVVIRPQNKRMQEHRKSLDNLERGDKVVTGGGVVAVVRKLQADDEIELEIAPGVIVTALRSTLLSIRESKTMKAAAQDAANAKK